MREEKRDKHRGIIEEGEGREEGGRGEEERGEREIFCSLPCEWEDQQLQSS